jgi:hypothetical protein
MLRWVWSRDSNVTDTTTGIRTILHNEAASHSTWPSRTEDIMYATRTMFAATTAVMAAKVELPMNASRSGRETRGGEGPHQDAPFHMYFSDAKYDVIGTIPRERLKTTSFFERRVSDCSKAGVKTTSNPSTTAVPSNEKLLMEDYCLATLLHNFCKMTIRMTI